MVKKGQIDHSSIDLKPIPNLPEAIKKLTSHFVGTHMQSYPPYSSVRVKGRPVSTFL
jgi:tRNA U55 pseudouridine synthase TruB